MQAVHALVAHRWHARPTRGTAPDDACRRLLWQRDKDALSSLLRPAAVDAFERGARHWNSGFKAQTLDADGFMQVMDKRGVDLLQVGAGVRGRYEQGRYHWGAAHLSVGHRKGGLGGCSW
jgi:hypothetical protein